MWNTNNWVFKVLLIVAWIIFVSLCIEAGGLLVNFFFNMSKPEYVQNLYHTLDLTAVYDSSKWLFFGIYSLIISVSVLKAFLFYVVIRLMHNMDINKPFNPYVSNQISLIGYYTLAIGLISVIASRQAIHWMHREMPTAHLNQYWADGQAFIIMGAVIYIIATIFKKGVELQTENDLTV